MAIDAHWITNQGKLRTQSVLFPFLVFISFSEECLIDFRELIGEHSGLNMANAVWTCLDEYKITHRVRYFSACPAFY
jgi:hypothetical protein